MNDSELGHSVNRDEKLLVGGYEVDARANTITGPEGAVSVEPKIMDVLLALCERSGEVVSREALLEAVWGMQHGGDESLTRSISILRKVFTDAPGGRRAIETFSKRGYRLNLPVSVCDAEADETRSAGRRIGVPAGLFGGWRRWAPVAAGFAVAGLALGAMWTMRDRDAEATQVVAAPAGSGRVAVEPWNASLPALADVARAGAPALGAAFAERGVASIIVQPQEGDARPAAELRVAGDVRMRAEALVVRLRMSDFASGEVLWSVERTQEGVEAVSTAEGAAAHFANVTECALSSRRRYAGTMPRAAMPAWLRYCDGAWSGDHAISLDAAERLLALTPDEAPARTAYAKALSWNYRKESDDLAGRWKERTEDAIEAVREVEPDSIDALALEASLNPNDWVAVERAIRALERADRTQKDGDEDLHYFLLRSVGYLDAALRQAALMTARLPGPSHLTEEAWLMATAGMRTRALQQLDEVIRLYPDYYNAYWRRFNILALSDDPESVELALFQAEQGFYPGKADEQLPCWRNYLLARLGRIDPVAALSEEVCIDTMHSFRARLHAALGQIDGALTSTALALDPDDLEALRGNTIHLFYPEMAEVRQDPRFWRMVDDIGLVDFWRSYERWPDFCSDRRVPVDCPAMAGEAIAGRT